MGSDGSESSTEFLYFGDHASFHVQGVPTLVLWTDLAKYWTLHHKASDTFDSVNKATLLQGDATVIATAYAIANSDTAFAPHLDAEQMRKTLEKTDDFGVLQNLRQRNLIP